MSCHNNENTQRSARKHCATRQSKYLFIVNLESLHCRVPRSDVNMSFSSTDQNITDNLNYWAHASRA